MSLDELHSRQCRLPELGVEGQARLEQANLVIGCSPGAFAEFSYLHRAGVGKALVSRLVSPPKFAHAEHFHFGPSRDLGAGAWRALRQIAAVVDWRTP